MIDFERIDTLQNFPLMPAASSSYREVDAKPGEAPANLYFAKKIRAAMAVWHCLLCKQCNLA